MGPGRPPLKRAERKGATFSVRLLPEERALIKRVADKFGVQSDSEWARCVLVDASREALALAACWNSAIPLGGRERIIAATERVISLRAQLRVAEGSLDALLP
jgi:hypothetical protein